VNELVTSPPYYWQRDYEVAGQIGRERLVREYLERLWAVFDQGRRVLTKDGICVVNLGDKRLKGCLQLIPHEFALGMKNRGWIVLNDVTWHKTNCKPESARSRFGCDSEYIFVFAKSRKHYFNKQYEPYSPKTIERCKQFVQRNEKFDPSRHKQDKHSPSQAPMLILGRIAKNLIVPGQSPNGMHIARANGINRDLFDSRGRGVRSVWALPTAQYRKAHFAAWPPKLVRRVLLAGCPPGGLVVDPFVGSGTTVVVAEDLTAEDLLRCTVIGIDLNADYLELARQEIVMAREKRNAAQARQSKRDEEIYRRMCIVKAAAALTINQLPKEFEEV
jgi:site-specific DNA-methyltransferase (adenine-specific)